MASADAGWVVPEPLATHRVQVDADAVITLRRHGNPDGPRLVISHGNGLAIDLYYPFWSLLTDEYDVIVYDLRNHGWNSVGALQNHNFPMMAHDHDAVLEAIERLYGKKPTVGVFHSVSGLASLLSPARGAGYSALVLFDPPVCKPDDGYEQLEAATMRTAAFVRRRGERFKSLAEFVEVLKLAPIYRRAVPGVPELLARTTLREDGEGYVLRCPRDYEAKIVDYARTFAVLVDFADLRCPAKVIGSDPTLPYSYLPSLDLSDILEVEYDFLPETTHFLQLEKPEECAEELREFLQSVGIR